MENETYIKLYRKLREHEILKDSNALQVFIWILICVKYKTGSMIIGRFWASNELNMNPNTFYKVLKRLDKKYDLVTLISNNKNTEVLVNNWKSYQHESNTIGNNKVTTKEQQSNNKVTLDKNIRNKEIKNIYTNIDDLNNLVLEEISAKYSVPLRAIQRKKDDLHMWLEEEPSRYKLKGKRRNLKLTLMNWVRRDLDSGKIKVEVKTELPNLPEISEEERQKNIATLAEMKSALLGGAK